MIMPDLERGVNFSVLSPEHGLESLFRLDDMGRGWQYAFMALVGDIFNMHGSAVSLAHVKKNDDSTLFDLMSSGSSAISFEKDEKQSLIREHPLIKELLNSIFKTKTGMFWNLVERYYSGDLNMDTISAESYLTWHLLKGMRGPNIDIIVRENRGNYLDTFSKLIKLLTYTHSISYDGPPRTLSSIQMGALNYIHLEQFDPRNSGVNIILLNQDDDDREWQEVTNWRSRQQAQLVSNGEVGQIISSFHSEMLNEPIEMIGNPATKVKWGLHTARAIRTVVTQSDYPMVGDSFAQIKDHYDDKAVTLSFSDFIGITTNLLIAFTTKPRETIRFIKQTGLEDILINYNDSVANQLCELIEKCYDFSDYSNNVEQLINELSRLSLETDYQDLNSIFTTAQVDLFNEEKRNLVSRLFIESRPAEKMSSLNYLVPLLQLFMPVKTDQITSLILAPGQKEKIKGKITGARLIGSSNEWRTVILDAIAVFEELKNEEECNKNRQHIVEAYEETINLLTLKINSSYNLM